MLNKVKNMAKNIIRLAESDLCGIISNVLNEIANTPKGQEWVGAAKGRAIAKHRKAAQNGASADELMKINKVIHNASNSSNKGMKGHENDMKYARRFKKGLDYGYNKGMNEK